MWNSCLGANIRLGWSVTNALAYLTLALIYNCKIFRLQARRVKEILFWLEFNILIVQIEYRSMLQGGIFWLDRKV
jgi:hypothetical protein